jgi:ferrous iron transport protein A
MGSVDVTKQEGQTDVRREGTEAPQTAGGEASGQGTAPRTLRDVKTGETVRVVNIGGAGALKRRIVDMGITKGVSIFVRKVAPLGDPVEVTVRGYELSLRKADAELVSVE